MSGHPTFSADVLLQAQGRCLGMRAAVFDVDGVLTDGKLHIDEPGESTKVFHVLDGQGLKLLRLGGIVPIIVTGRDSAAVRRRMADLGLEHAAFGARDKLAAAEALLRSIGVDWADTAAMGDDWPDLALFARAAFSCAPRNAHAEARAAAHYVTTACGGDGAVRECCDLLLMAAGRYRSLLSAHSATLDAR